MRMLYAYMYARVLTCMCSAATHILLIPKHKMPSTHTYTSWHMHNTGFYPIKTVSQVHISHVYMHIFTCAYMCIYMCVHMSIYIYFHYCFSNNGKLRLERACMYTWIFSHIFWYEYVSIHIHRSTCDRTKMPRYRHSVQPDVSGARLKTLALDRVKKKHTHTHTHTHNTPLPKSLLTASVHDLRHHLSTKYKTHSHTRHTHTRHTHAEVPLNGFCARLETHSLDRV